jgi:hypothetical protein
MWRKRNDIDKSLDSIMRSWAIEDFMGSPFMSVIKVLFKVILYGFLIMILCFGGYLLSIGFEQFIQGVM